jgi:deoxyribodipyrimidine photolyase-related protein
MAMDCDKNNLDEKIKQMHKKITLILGDQLFKNHPSFVSETDFVMIESKKLSTRFNYHKLKLAFTYTCMRDYKDFLQAKFPKAHIYYHTLTEEIEFEQILIELSQKYTEIEFSEITDKKFSEYIDQLIKKYFQKYTVFESQMFLTTKANFQTYLSQKATNKRLLMNDFYIWQRKRLKIFLNTEQKPLFQNWTFDEQNRKKIPKNLTIPSRYKPVQSQNWKKVCRLVEASFAKNAGKTESAWLATNHVEAEKVLENFLNNFLSFFGDYEDALDTNDPFLFHSVLSPYLNNGLLTPQEVLEKLFVHLENNAWLLTDHYNSIEGFVRQIIGWREWVKGMYDNFYQEDLGYNFFEAKQDLPEYFYFKNLENLDIQPLKEVLEKVENYAYAHHIERLMVLSNYFTLTEVDPKQVFDWFMEMFVDAYDWVMVPNVFGMGTFADGGIFASKPYISGANYLNKMGHFQKGTWQTDWTNLFWNFLDKHEAFFKKQPRLTMLLKNRKSKEVKNSN